MKNPSHIPEIIDISLYYGDFMGKNHIPKSYPMLITIRSPCFSSMTSDHGVSRSKHRFPEKVAGGFHAGVTQAVPGEFGEFGDPSGDEKNKGI